MELNKEEDKTGEKSNDISIQVDAHDNSSLAAHILPTTSLSKSSPLCSIHRVPIEMRKEKNNHRFDPLLASIGPYHHKKRTFKITEKHKKWYLRDLISRSGITTLEDLIKAIKDLEVEACECYAEIIDLNCVEFVTMMVVDGCFILQLMLKRDYYNSPWALISFSAAVVILLLTLIQTIYSVKSYYLPQS